MKPIGRGMRKSNAVHKAYKASAARAEKILVKVPWVRATCSILRFLLFEAGNVCFEDHTLAAQFLIKRRKCV